MTAARRWSIPFLTTALLTTSSLTSIVRAQPAPSDGTRGALQLTLPGATAPTVLYRKSYALVIGNDNYTAWPKLNNAIRDAEAVKDALEKVGFEVSFEKDLTRDKLAAKLEEWFLFAGIEEDARLLVWFAGHGHTIERSGVDPHGFIVGIDTPQAPRPLGPPRGEAEFRRGAVAMDRFSEWMRGASAKHVLVVLDSCFSGTVFSSTRDGGPPPLISGMTALPTRQFITSGTAGQKVLDDGTFRRLFVGAMTGLEPEADANKDGYVTGTELGLFLQSKIADRTNNRQKPVFGPLRETGFDRGDFVFSLGRADASAPRAPASEQDEAFWLFIRDQNSVALTEGFIARFPTSRFRAAAIEHLQKLRGTVAAQPGSDTSAATLPYSEREIIYGTNRKQAAPSNGRTSFSADSAGALTLGRAVITIPKQRMAGTIQRPSTEFFGFSLQTRKADPARDFTVMSNDRLTQAEAAQLARPEAGGGQALIFIHGYNVAFDDALFRAAQLAEDMNFKGRVLVYSWPSSGRTTDYLRDRDAVVTAAPYFAEFLNIARQQLGVQTVHILAHGTGNVLATETLRGLAVAGSASGARIGEYIAAQPDMSADQFDAVCPSIKRSVRGITVYASSNDKALLASRRISGGVGRAGEVTSSGPAVGTCADVIDVSKLDTDFLALGHATVGQQSNILTDMAALIEGGTRPPAARSMALSTVTGAKGTYWRFER